MTFRKRMCSHVHQDTNTDYNKAHPSLVCVYKPVVGSAVNLPPLRYDVPALTLAYDILVGAVDLREENKKYILKNTSTRWLCACTLDSVLVFWVLNSSVSSGYNLSLG